jgi:CheY-like chemotaxis protein
MLEGKRIFIIEDEVRNRVIYKLLLPKYGATVEFEGWGPEALAHLERWGAVDLIIMDLMLQRGISGYDLFSTIRQRAQFDTVPIVAVSAADATAAIAKTSAMGFAGFIAKPIHQERFASQLARILAGERIWDTGDRIQVNA